eukprot:12642132-Heterocapsa_arctica.AAC.1
MSGSIAGKHLMDYIRAAKANQSGANPLISMAVPDVHHFYSDELANDPFKRNPGIMVGHDKVEVSKVQQVICLLQQNNTNLHTLTGPVG